LRKTKKRTIKNSQSKVNVKQLFKKAVDLAKEGKLEEAKSESIKFQQAIDKAAKNRVVSGNRARRKKSALMRALNKK
jgi:ribosomal protein S20